MSTLVSCPTCQTKLQINPENAGLVLRCPRCNNTFRLRAAETVHSAPPDSTKVSPPAAPRPAPQAAPQLMSQTTAKPAPKPVSKAVPKVTSKSPSKPAPKVSSKAALKVATRPPTIAAGARRPAPLPANTNRTVLGQALPPPVSTPPPCVPTPPPLAPAPLPVSPRSKGGLILWVLLGCLLMSLLGGGGFTAYYLWKNPASGSANSEQRDGGDLSAAFGKWGIIEIGAKGIKTIVLDIFASEDKEDYDFNIVWQADANPTLVATGTDELAFAPEALTLTQEHVKRFHNTMRDKHGVSQERIFVVSSSGLWVPFAKDPAALAKNKKALAERVKAAADLPLHEISVLDEARLGMKTCVPRKDLPVAVFLDIGSGNTKGGYFESRDVFEGTDVKLGSVTYAARVKEEAKRTGKPFAEQAADLRPAALEQPLREQLDRLPGLGRQPKVHLAGGAVWALATFTHPSETKLRLELTAADIDRFAVLVRKPEDAVRNEVLSEVKDLDQWKKAQKEIGRVQKKFRPENLQAAAEILKALSNVYNFKDKRLFFFRNSYVAWPMGFVLERSKIRE